MSVMAKADICRLIPHAGAMCLLDTVDAWTESCITCTATSHRDVSNPLRQREKLEAICGLEYAAQAMAVHIGLVHKTVPHRTRVGYLGGIRNVALQASRLDTLADDLLIQSTRLLAESDSFLYSFQISSSGRELMSGRASIFLRSIEG
jgi:predicted hotdog family 3-hydroxylacyl-ACP dehydratase